MILGMKITHLEGTCTNCKTPQTKTMPFEDYEKYGQDLKCGKCHNPISFQIIRIEEN